MQDRKEKNNSPVKSSVPLWTRIITKNSEWPDKDEFLDVIYWARQILAIILDSSGAFSHFRESWESSFVKNCLFHRFGVVNAGLLYVYFSSFQSIDEEEFGGAWELTKEGFMTSFAGFLVTWIIVYSGLHFD
nr:EOG090X0M4M [Eulimnadia texana]